MLRRWALVVRCGAAAWWWWATVRCSAGEVVVVQVQVGRVGGAG